MDLHDQILLSIINNIAIGAIVAFGAYMLNRSLEKYKTSQAMRAEAEKLRINNISPIWEDIHRIHDQLNSIREVSYEIKKEEASKLRDEENLRLHEENSIAPPAREKFLKGIMPKLSETRIGLDRLLSQVEAKRFWLGAELLNIHKEQLEALQELADLMEEDIFKHNSVKSIDRYFKIGKKLRPSNLDITSVLNHM